MTVAQISPAGLAWDWAQYVGGLRFAQLPTEVVVKAKAVLLHNIAVAFGGIGSDQGRLAVEMVEARESGVTVIGSRKRGRPAEAGLANSVLVRAMRMEDVLLPSETHPGATLIPAALAVGEAEGASGEELLTALVAGYDVLGRTAGGLSTVDLVGRAPHHVFGGIATAAVAARLMRLQTDQIAGALCYGANLATMVGHGFQDFQYGLITRNGIHAAELGRARAPYISTALEKVDGFYAAQLKGVRPSPEELLGGLGTRFDILRTAIKPHPCTGSNLVSLELLHQAIQRHGLTNETVRRVVVTVSQLLANQANLTARGPFDAALGGPPDGAHARGMYVATSSLPFAIANILLTGTVAMEAFEFPDAPHLVPVIAKVRVDYGDLPDELRCRLEIETTDGRLLRSEGGYEMIRVPDSAALLRRNAAGRIEAEKAERLIAVIDTLEAAPDLSALTSCLA